VTQEVEIPEAVRRQAEMDAEAERAELAKLEELKSKPTQTAEQVVQSVATPPAEPQPRIPTPQPPQQTSGDVAERLAQLEQDLARERQRSRTLQGMIDAQGPQMAETIRALREEVEQLRNGATKPGSAEDRTPGYLRHLDQDERSMFDDGKLPVESRIAQGMIDERTAKLEAELKQLRQEIATAKTAKAAEPEKDSMSTRIWNAVDAQCPGASIINENPVWIEWLNEVDPNNPIGKTFGEIGEAYFNTGDVSGIVKLVETFKRIHPGQVALIERQIRPAVARGNAEVKREELPTVSESEVRAFYKDKALGKLRNAEGAPMTPEEARKIEEIIESAIAAGRITRG